MSWKWVGQASRFCHARWLALADLPTQLFHCLEEMLRHDTPGSSGVAAFTLISGSWAVKNAAKLTQSHRITMSSFQVLPSTRFQPQSLSKCMTNECSDENQSLLSSDEIWESSCQTGALYKTDRTCSPSGHNNIIHSYICTSSRVLVYYICVYHLYLYIYIYIYTSIHIYI